MNLHDAAQIAVSIITIGLPAAATAQIPPSVEFRVPKAPTVAAIGDTLGTAAYEMHVTNLSGNLLSLKRIEAIRESDGRVLLTLEDSVLLRAIARPGSTVAIGERAKIGGGLRAIVFLWVPVDRSTPPAALRHRLTFERVAPDTGVHVFEGAVTPVSTSIAQIGPPLRGEWLAANGPSNASGHRRSALGLNGSVAIAQRFAIDFLQIDNKDATTRSDRSSNDNFYAENQDVLSVADGIVVDTKDSIPENIPGGRAVPINLITVGGNYIVVDIGNGRYAFYAHLRPGSLRVKVGDRVQRGQVIGLVGNSGNSTEPHLHFHIGDAVARGTSTLGAEGLPYAIDRMEVLGSCAVVTAIGPCKRSPPVTLRNAMPGQNQLVRFSPTGR